MIDRDPEILDADLDREDLEQSPMEIIESKTDPEWTVHSVILSDESEERLYLLVHRSTDADNGDLILEERYFTLSLEDPRESGYSDNGISRRVSRLGTLIGLRIAYSALSDEISEGVESNTLSIEAVNGHVDHSPDTLEREISEQLDLPDSWRESEIPDTPTTPGLVLCRRCDTEIPKAEAVQFGSGDLGQFWVCDTGERDCPGESR